MKTLPLNLVPYKRTAEVTNVSVPSGLLYAYQTREEVWGKIVVFEGALTYRILEPVAEEISLAPSHYGVIEQPPVRLGRQVENMLHGFS